VIAARIAASRLAPTPGVYFGDRSIAGINRLSGLNGRISACEKEAVAHRIFVGRLRGSLYVFDGTWISRSAGLCDGVERRNVTKEDVEKLISERYRSLPPKLKAAARHVLDAPKDVAIQSMRSVAADAELQPATMLRLARELGFRSYATFRELYVNWLSSNEMTFVARAKSLRKRREGDGQEKLFAEMYATEVVSLDRTLGGANAAAFASAKKLLIAARRFYVLGLRSLFPAAYYLDYACRLFSDKSVLLTGVGGAIADELRRATAKDALVAFSFEPYAQLTVEAVQYAAERNVRIDGQHRVADRRERERRAAGAERRSRADSLDLAGDGGRAGFGEPHGNCGRRGYARGDRQERFATSLLARVYRPLGAASFDRR
jgi:DNA-binding MurR/RpiR family transcriptional regulator